MAKCQSATAAAAALDSDNNALINVVQVSRSTAVSAASRFWRGEVSPPKGFRRGWMRSLARVDAVFARWRCSSPRQSPCSRPHRHEHTFSSRCNGHRDRACTRIHTYMRVVWHESSERKRERENEDHPHTWGKTHIHGADSGVLDSVRSAPSDVGQCSRLRCYVPRAPRLKLPLLSRERGAVRVFYVQRSVMQRRVRKILSHRESAAVHYEVFKKCVA